jgi:hypothetical protein
MKNRIGMGFKEMSLGNMIFIRLKRVFEMTSFTLFHQWRWTNNRRRKRNIDRRKRKQSNKGQKSEEIELWYKA